jgi:competence protein ComFC
MKAAGHWYDHPAYSLHHLFWTAVDWLYPPTCGGCQKSGERWCVECQNKVTPVGPQICPICGNFNDDGEICPTCSASPPPYQALRSWGIFIGPLREAIHRLKYQHDIGLAEILANHLIDLFHSTGWEVDLIVPVPLSYSRLLERGYNQSALLARPLAQITHTRYQPKAVARIRNTPSQVGLKARQRIENVREAFLSEPAIVNGKRILLVDDVATTGATLSECARTLKEANAHIVYGLTLARSSFGLEINDNQAA